MATSVGGSQNPLDTVDDGNDDTNDNRTISAGDVLSRAEHLSHGDNQFDKYCADFTQRAVMGSDFSPQGNAGDWYSRVKRQGAVNTTVSPPAGTAVFYDTSNVNDHVAVSAGNGYVWSTGINGKIQRVPMDNLYGGGAGSTPNRGWTSRFGNKYVNYDKSGLTDVGSSTSTASTRTSAGTTPEVPHAARAALASEMSSSMSDSTPSGPLAGDISVLNPNKSPQFGSLNTSGPVVTR